ncbi:divalent metal cation transporter [Herbiconiux moechotypicola]|uniref:Divalent metal cation transporter n=1 Tax=Herbiconiux moechotypicola TaxID=637393 RepID=A0ABP5QKG0_9MICO|nr:divalent metal cation transporter [Herbiconiux moechotypicola]MCS5731711.1 divalent metal cation transporter [Herbiconiux moechotypicola]
MAKGATQVEGTRRIPKRVRWFAFLAVAGPGLAVMLADTDAGSLITAAQSGAQWGYTLLSAQIVLIPIVFIAQELTVRLGLVTGKGHGELIRQRFGRGWAWLSVSTLAVACAGAIVSEMSGIAGVGLMWGIPTWASTGAVGLFLVLMVVTGSYKRVERVAIGIGLFELVFLVTAVLARPDPAQVAEGLLDVPVGDSGYLFLVAANIGAVVMPWMIFYQQSAVVDKGLGPTHLKGARLDTAVGAVVTQLVMIGMLVTTAATLWATNQSAVDLDSVEQISDAITPHLGDFAGRILFSMGMIGASLVAAIVASLTAAWGLGEVAGYRRSLESSPRQAPWFYLVFGGVMVLGVVVVESGVNLVDLNLFVQVMNALLLPIVLGFLYLLALKALPDPYRLRGFYAWFVGVLLAVTAAFGVYSAVAGILGGP